MDEQTPAPLMPRSSRRPTTPPWVAAAGIGIATVAVLIVMNPALLLTANTPSGGDMGAHVLVPAYLRDTLLPEGRILGWSNSWFAGFPVFYFYFPLPSLVTVLLDFVLPYGVAFKIVTVMGLLALPPSIYFHARAMTLGRHVSLIAAGTAAVFAFLESYKVFSERGDALAADRDALKRDRLFGQQGQERLKAGWRPATDDEGESWRQVSPSDRYMERASGTYGWVFSHPSPGSST